MSESVPIVPTVQPDALAATVVFSADTSSAATNPKFTLLLSGEQNGYPQGAINEEYDTLEEATARYNEQKRWLKSMDIVITTARVTDSAGKVTNFPVGNPVAYRQSSSFTENSTGNSMDYRYEDFTRRFGRFISGHERSEFYNMIHGLASDRDRERSEVYDADEYD